MDVGFVEFPWEDVLFPQVLDNLRVLVLLLAVCTHKVLAQESKLLALSKWQPLNSTG